MRIFMQIPAIDNKPPRFYHLILQEDLLEGWTLVRETGRQGAPGKLSTKHYETLDKAVSALVKSRDAQLKRGYLVVFTEGQTMDQEMSKLFGRDD